MITSGFSDIASISAQTRRASSGPVTILTCGVRKAELNWDRSSLQIAGEYDPESGFMRRKLLIRGYQTPSYFVTILNNARSFNLTGMKEIQGITSRTKVYWIYKKSISPLCIS
jgi:hypothetical protein